MGGHAKVEEHPVEPLACERREPVHVCVIAEHRFEPAGSLVLGEPRARRRDGLRIPVRRDDVRAPLQQRERVPSPSQRAVEDRARPGEEREHLGDHDGGVVVRVPASRRFGRVGHTSGILRRASSWSVGRRGITSNVRGRLFAT